MNNTNTLKLFLYTILLAICWTVPVASVDNNQYQWFEKMAGNIGRHIDEIQRNERWYYQNRQQERDRLNETIARYPNSAEAKAAQAKLDQMKHEDERFEKAQDTVNDITQNAFKKATDVIASKFTADQQLKQAEHIAAIDNHGRLERLNRIIESLQDPETLKKALIFLAGATVITIGGYHAIKITAKQIEKYFDKPNIVKKTSRKGLKEMIYAAIHGIEPEPIDINDMVFEPGMGDRFFRLANDVKHINEFGLTYENAIFYGPPGTGKTFGAELLAFASGLDYAILSAADITSAEQINDLYTWAQSNHKGTIIFIDEADVLLSDRSKYTDHDRTLLINEWLSWTGNQSNKFMTIVATNYPSRFDSAANDRFPLAMEFKLPSEDVRMRMLRKKIDKEIIADVRTFERDGQTITVSLTLDASINDAYIATLAQRTHDFSGRDIDQLVKRIRMRGYLSDNNHITKAIVEDALQEKIEQVRKKRLIAAAQNSDDTAKLNTALATQASKS